MLDILFIVFILIVFAPVCLIFHELGHIFAAKLVKSNEIELMIGHGKLIWQQTAYGIHITVRRIFFMNCMTSCDRHTPYTARDKIIIAMMGPLFSLFLAFLLYVVYSTTGWIREVYVLSMFNAWVGWINLIPFKVGQKESDGYTVYRQLFL